MVGGARCEGEKKGCLERSGCRGKLLQSLRLPLPATPSGEEK